MAAMAYWLVKSEPSVYSIHDLKRDRVTHWHGVRNFQARNYLRAMAPGDSVLFYHSNEEPVGVAGLAEVKRVAYPDPSQFDAKSEFYDPRATVASPRWFCPDIVYVDAFAAVVPLAVLRAERRLADMVLLKRGTRLSVQPVTGEQFKAIVRLGAGSPPAPRSRRREVRV